jgi:hypothetical protein
MVQTPSWQPVRQIIKRHIRTVSQPRGSAIIPE